MVFLRKYIHKTLFTLFYNAMKHIHSTRVYNTVTRPVSSRNGLEPPFRYLYFAVQVNKQETCPPTTEDTGHRTGPGEVCHLAV